MATAYDARQNLALPRIDPKNYMLSGMERGVALKTARMKQEEMEQEQARKSALGALMPKITQGDQQATQQALAIDPTGKSIQGALDYQKGMEDKKQEFLARGSFEILNAYKESPEKAQRMYSKFMKDGMKTGYIPESQEDDTLDADDLEVMQGMVNNAREFKDLIPAEMTPYQKAQIDIARQKKNESKQTPLTFAKQFNDRLEMDIDAIDELPAEDVKIIRAATAKGMREGMDFEEAYNTAIDSLGLQEAESSLFSPSTWGTNDYKLAPQESGIQQPNTPKQVDPEEQVLRDRLDAIKEIKKQKGYK